MKRKQPIPALWVFWALAWQPSCSICTTQVVFGSLTILFLLLSIGDFSGNHTITMIAGYKGIFCGLSAIYSAMGQIVNAEYGKTILPLG